MSVWLQATGYDHFDTLPNLFTCTNARSILYHTFILNAIAKIKKDMRVRIIPTVKNIIYSLPNERKISVKTEVIEEVYYVSCDHLIKTKKGDIKSLINMTKEELMKKYFG